MQPTSRFVTANGLRHHVLEWDGGGRTTVVCLHGFLDVAWAFHRVGFALAEAGHHVIAPDLRGHGQTDRVGAGGYYHFMDYVLDLAEIVDQIARDRLALVGHSMGGSISAYFAGSFPDRVWRTVILESLRLPDTPARALPGLVAEWVSGVRRARTSAPRVYESIEAAARTIRRHDPLCPEAEARFLAEQATRPVPGGVAFTHDRLHLTRAPYPFRVEYARPFWEAVRCPVLFVEGSESGPPPGGAPPPIAAFRHARRVVIAGAGHMIMRHRPQEVAAVLAEFMDDGA